MAKSPSDESRSQLDEVRPPAPPCPAAGDGVDDVLVAAETAFQEGVLERALACSERALLLAPQSVGALHDRAAALAGLGRTAEARLAYARALVEAPEDPETLRGAADLYVLRSSGERSALELGLAYAERGARRALRPPYRDRPLAGDLHLLGATAANGLGESKRALEHAGDALRLGADEAQARYERGVALYDLCRFAEARSALEGSVALAPDDAWAVHQLALTLERLGETRRAAELTSRAAKLAPEEFPAPVVLSAREFADEVHRAVASLPESERRSLEGVPVELSDLPAMADLVAVEPPLSPSILGLYRGPPAGERCSAADGPHCRSMVFYRRNLERFARTRGELEEQVKVTLLHELGHLHGESDQQLRARGLE